MRRSFLEEVVLELHILKVERAKERAEGNSSQQGKQEQKHRDARVSALLWIVLHMQAWLIQRKYLEGCLGIQVEPDC